MATYDYVVVGGGSAGSVIAARLSEDPDVRVLLLEAGGRDWHPYIHMPAGFAKMTTGPLTWGLVTEPQEHANGREIAYAQARVLGGGGSINAEIYTRGTARDYDRWATEEGCPGWSSQEVQKYFLRAEGNSILSGAHHGNDGPLGVSTIPQPTQVSLGFVQACQQVGMPFNPDFNGASQEGAGLYQTTIRNGRRCSAAVAYLKPARTRKNLTVLTGCVTTRIIIQNGRATGVEYVQSGDQGIANADREVVVTSGAIGSPKLLMLSGIGRADELTELGVKPVHDLPGVGQNLNDHFGVDIVHELSGEYGLDKYNKPHWMVWAGLQYVVFGSGPVTSNVVEAGAFWHSHPGESEPDLQFHFLAAAGVEKGVPAVPSGSGCTLNSYALRPKSRGYVKLRTARVEDKPIVNPNYLAESYDREVAAEGVRISREVMEQPALRKLIKKEHFPGPAVRTTADLEEYCRQYGRTSYHPVGTCKMGTDEMSVVDPQLRVRGIDGLRVADSSIMPSLIGSNTNAPTIMIGEKASDLIHGNR